MVFLDDFLIGGIKGRLRKDDFYSAAFHHVRISYRIWKGLFRGGPLHFLLRMSWELPQTVAGLFAAHGANLFAQVEEALYIRDVTLLKIAGRWGGLSLSPFILGDSRIGASLRNPLFLHEYGHCLQSRMSGPFYIFVYGIPSLISASFSKKHHESWMEKDADRRSRLFSMELDPSSEQVDARKAPPHKETGLF